ncbi:MAG TPA: hypothetical protein VFU04_09830 [Solirubrobacterales bacterium]|nr:hypothetical protein [Solirubrobacterales bacterium]
MDCGYGAAACYYPDEDGVVLSGDEAPADDGASREFVLAHEYGHHVANHRQSVAPFPAAIDWGTPRWSSHEQICRADRRGAVFPGDEEDNHDRNPGEALAEAFACLHFPRSGVEWGWARSLRPDAAAFEAIREDTLNPWLGRMSIRLRGPAWSASRKGLIRAVPTPLDGRVSLLPAAALSRSFRLSLWSPAGQILRSSRGDPTPGPRLDFTVCGQSRLQFLLLPKRRPGTPVPLLVERP